MRFALDGHGTRTRTRANPGQRATCPGCGNTVIAKCGAVLTWHWAHQTLVDCDWEPGRETDWHLNWKDAAPDDRQEVRINGHRADIVGASGLVVELQHSHLSASEIAKREYAYRNMVWLFDARAARAEGRLMLRVPPDRNPEDLYRNIRWEHTPAYLGQVAAPLFLDLDADTLLWVGKWYESAEWAAGQTMTGYGWQVPHEWFRRVVINGPHYPRTPRGSMPLTKARLETQLTDPAAAANDSLLDWRSHTVGPLRACRICGQPAFMRDADGRPCHKVCAEDDQPLTTPEPASQDLT